MTIHKYSLKLGANEIEMPANSSVLTVRLVDREFYLLAIINPDAPLKRRKFQVVGENNTLPDNCKDKNYISTVVDDGPYFYHIFVTRY